MNDFVSNGWSWFVIISTVAGLVFCVVVLFGAARHRVIRDEQGKVIETTGHVWDGDLQELNNPLPRWWMWLFLITVIYSVAYLVLYPGMGSFQGTLGWSSTGQLQDEQKAARVAQDEVYARFKLAAVEDMARDPQALAIGERLFLNNCAACHGSDARGSKGFPNLTDKDWLYGGDPDKIIESITLGRHGNMPPMAAAVGSAADVRAVAQYVLSLSGSSNDSIQAQLGRDKFKTACAACHGADGKGTQALGAPNLSDKIWLHGWGEGTVMEIVNKGKVSMMPPQQDRLTPEQIKVLASYVWGLSNPSVVSLAP